MGKKMFALIILLMSISLIGIITVQVFWISNAIDIREKQFSDDVKFALAKTNEIIDKRAIVNFIAQFRDYDKERKIAKKVEFRRFEYQQVNTSTNESFSFSSSGVYQDKYYKGVNDYYKNDSILVAQINSKNDVYTIKKRTDDTELGALSDAEKFTFYSSLSEPDKFMFRDVYENKDIPIYRRLSNEVIEEVLSRELLERGIDINYRYGVYSNLLPTKIKSSYYEKERQNNYMTPLFTKDKFNKNYELYITFPQKEHFILSDIGVMLLLSVFFTIIIMLAFASSLYQLVKQKKISSIKTDFINNMTHEFKTPIATINLALDAIRNPQVINDNSKVLRYVTMIKEENKRMHTQVENVLRISKLEKNQLDVSKTAIDFYEVLEDAISHVHLLLNDKQGVINIHGEQVSSEGLGNEFHLTNVFVNILENAIKYSESSPEIDIFIESSVKFLTIQIKDKGIGMGKAAQKHAFDKFYREQKGNIHDVKGHGLGLSYVKEIIEHHQGTIFVESEKGKGSVFTVKLPLVS